MSFNLSLMDAAARSAIASSGMTETTVGKIFLEMMKMLFMDPDGFQVYEMRNRTPKMRWDADLSVSQVKIVQAEDWKPEEGGKLPEVVIRTQGTNWVRHNNAGRIDSPDDTAEMPDYITYDVIGRVILWSVSTVPAECKMMGWEIAEFWGAFSVQICQEWGWDNLQPAAVGPPVHLAERKEAWGVPAVLAVGWSCSQAISRQSLKLAEIISETDIGDQEG